ncbi:MAG TPA: flagellar biosynthetic protein FliO [Phycisphaerae bacterium]|nr:flagellar biosynthetic protein FliO [Phycisphaerae bacterium]
MALTTPRLFADETQGGSPKSADAVAAWLQVNSTAADKPPSPTLKRQRPARQENQKTAESGTTSLPYGKMVWPLAAVLGTITLAAWALRKWSAGAGRLGSTGAITVLARHYLSSKQSLCLVRLGNRVVLLGVTPDSITAVADLERGDAAGLLAGIERARPGSFFNALAGIAPAPASNPATRADEATVDDASGRVQSLVERMKACGAGS